MKTFSAETLNKFCFNILTAEGVEESCAQDVADLLIDAELTGVTTHGISRLSVYVQRVRAGIISKANNIHVLRESSSALVIDAGNTFGAPSAKYAMQACIRNARESGCCFATVKNSNHFGTGAFYTKLAAKEDMIGFICTNVTAKIAPYGSKTAYIGTNPFSVSAPTEGDPFLLDMTPTVVALGKLIDAQRLGKPIPIGWALDEDGRPTTDPAAGRRGSLVPIGGAKGSGMAMAVEILAGILSGAGYSRYLHDLYSMDSPQGLGHFLGAIDIAHFTDVTAFKTMLSSFTDEVRHLDLAEGFSEIRIPGERGFNQQRKSLKDGILIPDSVYDELIQLGSQYGLTL